MRHRARRARAHAPTHLLRLLAVNHLQVLLLVHGVEQRAHVGERLLGHDELLHLLPLPGCARDQGARAACSALERAGHSGAPRMAFLIFFTRAARAVSSAMRTLLSSCSVSMEALYPSRSRYCRIMARMSCQQRARHCALAAGTAGCDSGGAPA